MKTLLVGVLFACYSMGVYAQPTLEEALSDVSTADPYIVFQVKTDHRTEYIALRNRAAAILLVEELDLKYEDYVATMVEHIENNEPLMISDSLMSRLEGNVIKVIDSVRSVEQEGKEYVLKYYFNERENLKRRLSREEELYLTKVLFDWGIFVRIRDLGGDYALYRRLLY